MADSKDLDCIDVVYDQRVNYASQQNDVPLIKSLSISNNEDIEAQNVTVSISSDPVFAKPFTAHIATIKSHQSYTLNPVDIQLSPTYLGNLSERISGQISVTVQGTYFPTKTRIFPIEVLAYDEWAGLNTVPELLAAFSLPNHPSIDKLLRDASDILGKATGNSSLDGYQQKDRKRAWQIGAAIYTAILRLDIHYSNPPASFEENGQKVRTPDRILSGGLATCLDLSLLSSACLEQAGLNPVIVLFDGHSFPGFWLRDETFEFATIDDPLALRKRVDLNDICIYESTLLTQQADFRQAIDRATAQLNNVESFRVLIDIKRARRNRIRPLPFRHEGDGQLTDITEGTAEHRTVIGLQSVSNAPDLPDWEDSSGTLDKTTQKEDRLTHWKRKLLDLSLRNRLLNFRETNKTLRLDIAKPAVLEDLIASGREFKVLPRTDLFTQQSGRDEAVHIQRTTEDAKSGFLLDEMNSGRLHSAHDKDITDTRLLEILRSSKEAIEEGGANTLYLAIGFLSWIPDNRPKTQKCLAPILLVPVELTRKSLRHGFVIRGHDDDTIVNVTLLQLLEQDFKLPIHGLDMLPVDESGVDVPAILSKFKHAVRDVAGWEVLDQVALGMFSFNKYLMWKDLQDHTELLLKNDIIDHLVNHPDKPFSQDGTFPDERTLDSLRHPSGTYCPLIADSSQLTAIYAAQDGKSFVMMGPPGTGKSQTISNIIAQCLATGKTVLFVSEKMAALNVVYERLAREGLSAFCLELHSNKARKREVVDQLAKSLQLERETLSDVWDHDTDKLSKLRTDLNNYVTALHSTNGHGMSAFHAISQLVALQNIPSINFTWSSESEDMSKKYEELEELVDRFTTVLPIRQEINSPLFDAVQLEEWTPSAQSEATSAVQNVFGFTTKLLGAARKVSLILSLPNQGWSYEILKQMNVMALLFMERVIAPVRVVTALDGAELDAKLTLWIKHGRARDALRVEILEKYDKAVFTLDASAMTNVWNTAEQSWWPKRWLLKHQVYRELKKFKNVGSKIVLLEIPDDLAILCNFSVEEQLLRKEGDEARTILGRFWHDGEADWDQLVAVQTWTAKVRAASLALSDNNPLTAQALREKWAAIVTADTNLVSPGGKIGTELLAFRELFHQLEEGVLKLSNTLHCNKTLAFGDGKSADYLGRILDFYRATSPHLGRLRQWCIWRRTRTEMERAQLSPLVEAAVKSVVTTEHIRDAFRKGFYKWWLDKAIEREPVLREFLGTEHQRKIERFRGQDQKCTGLARDYIKSKLASRVPRGGAALNDQSELGILNREIHKKKGLLPIRRLVESIPNVLPRLKPCVLMSPLSVAQYLPPGRAWFDVVIFDEASQIAVWDAMGPIARGKSLVVAGDPKQMPPTNFFEHTGDIEDEDQNLAVQDMESILDECNAAGFPNLPLRWHYRSRHESLIAFSNYQYYENELLTFPSAQNAGLGVSFRHVSGGIYDRGKSRTNREEAETIVREIVSRLTDPQRRQYSIGVVTFNVFQQRLIEDLLETARNEHPELERYFSSEDVKEPVFVKNLENVQGDERDVMLFSICYGRDHQGRSSVNFGPLNRDGGQRRLNVAVTRARRELIVFSGIKAEDIDLRRTAAQGVEDLKAFLDYAEHGAGALYSQLRTTANDDVESPFEQEVKRALSDKGWQVQTQIGCSGYRVDLAVIDPRTPGKYLAGIECDGATYHSAATARDRDRLRELILRGLGWKIYRVWSTDWWSNAGRELERIDQELRNLLNKDSDPDTSKGANSGASESSPVDPPICETGDELKPIRRVAYDAKSFPNQRPYQPWIPKGSTRTQGDFYLPNSVRSIIADIEAAVKTEGPLIERLLVRRIGEAWGFSKITDKLTDRLRQLASRASITRTGTRPNAIYWQMDQNPTSYRIFRVSDGSASETREIEEIPLEELTNGSNDILAAYLSISADGLIQETAKLFGVKRLTHGIQSHVKRVLPVLIKRGVAKDDTGSIVFSGSS